MLVDVLQDAMAIARGAAEAFGDQGPMLLATDLADEEPRFQAYVIVHALLHLKVPNHGRLFKVRMTAYVPGWRTMPSGASPPGRPQAAHPREA